VKVARNCRGFVVPRLGSRGGFIWIW